MQKLIAFDLYERNEHGGHQHAFPSPGAGSRSAAGREVYLASDVHALLQTLSHARLTWAMACACNCQACAQIDDAIKDLMVK